MNESENDFRFILENVLCIEDSSQVTVQLINIIEGVEWDVACINDEIRFLSKNFRSDGFEITSPNFRKIYSGANRRKLPILHLYYTEKEISGAFPLKLVSRIWKLSIREKLVSIKLVPFIDDPYRAKYLEIEFQSGLFRVRGVHQLFPTEDYFQTNVEYSKKYALAYEKFKEITPFTVDRIIDLLSTDEIATSFEAWENDPIRFDIPGVDTANIYLARKLADELNAEELDILVKQIRDIMIETDWEDMTDKQTIERYSQFLKYIKKIRKIKKEEPPEDYTPFTDYFGI
ncbi:MAG: hypothetical protein H7641_05375 [Candidatus Heimdallarchaeota archaeon]|nr:hypothetical protein [Candidatus Heimdallarchaeota archaeon]MCK4876992.1 hypothetical protein [Candidatus Heimdallarchaeota archaeon]